ncbi:MAG: hypothetical protein EHM23_35250 [Acidobacteria bacterium]|nr:MAG: hypothetical protein EHM23_35250 [Acidobacteriota bacterium]
MSETQKEGLNRVIARQPFPLLSVTVSGAHLYWFPLIDSGYDLRGVHLLPLEKVVGLEVEQETMQLSGDEEGLEIDLVTHDIRKFITLMLKRITSWSQFERSQTPTWRPGKSAQGLVATKAGNTERAAKGADYLVGRQRRNEGLKGRQHNSPGRSVFCVGLGQHVQAQASALKGRNKLHGRELLRPFRAACTLRSLTQAYAKNASAWAIMLSAFQAFDLFSTPSLRARLCNCPSVPRYVQSAGQKDDDFLSGVLTTPLWLPPEGRTGRSRLRRGSADNPAPPLTKAARQDS